MVKRNSLRISPTPSHWSLAISSALAGMDMLTMTFVPVMGTYSAAATGVAAWELPSSGDAFFRMPL